MAPKLYILPSSPPARAVLMTAESLGIELDIQILDLHAEEHKSPQYIKMCPQHTIPLLDDDGFYLADSHAINAYLVQKYGKDDSLYPKNLKERAKVDERLHFDNGTLFSRFLLCIKPLIYDGKTGISEKARDDLMEAYSTVEKFLESNQWIAGDKMTIADFSVFTTAIATDVIIPTYAIKYPKLSEWINKIARLPVASGAVNEGLQAFKDFILPKLHGNVYVSTCY